MADPKLEALIRMKLQKMQPPAEPPIFDDTQPQPQPPAAPGAQGYGGQPGIMEMAQSGGLGQIAPVAGGVKGMQQNNMDQFRQISNTPVNGHMASPESVDMAFPQQQRPDPGLVQTVMKMLAGGAAPGMAGTVGRQFNKTINPSL